MNRSGMKRGLAASAVAALAVSGVTLGVQGPASAAGGVDWKTQLVTNIGSVQDDGSNSTIHLQATGPAAAAKMLFEYSTNGGSSYTDIATVGPVSGVAGLFSAEWTPAPALHNTDVLVRARAISSVDTPIAGAFDTHTVFVSTTDHAVNIANAPGSALGVYQRPGDGQVNGIVTGATSDIVGGTDVFLDSVNGAGADLEADFYGPVSGNTRTFSGVADFAGDPVGSGYALVRATDGSDDVEPVKLYNQTVGSITAEASRTLVPSGETASATVTVLDQNGKPIAGLAVRRSGGPGAGLTNSRGQVTFNGLSGSSGGTVYRYYADANNNNDYSEATEFAKTVTITSYSAVATKISAATELGHAWDRDETAAIVVRVDDQNNNGFGPQQVQYQWSVAPSGGGAPTTFAVQTANVAGGGPGKGTVNIGDVPDNTSGTWTLKTWIEVDGTPGMTAGDSITFTDSFKVGQASVKWTDGNVAQRPLGTTQQFEGVLSLPDGTPLTNRDFSVFLGAQNGAENAVMAAQAAQPAGATRAPIPFGDTQVNVVSDANGAFKVAVSDPAGGSFEDRTLSAAGGDFGPETQLEVDFMDTTVDHVELDGDTPVVIDGDDLTPGRPSVVGDVRVYNAANQLLTDKSVTIAVDKGYLTELDGSDLVPAAPQSEGGLVGAWKHVAGDTSATFTTADGPVLGGAGRGTVADEVAAAIDRDAGFDDDGQVTTKITATSAAKSATDDVVWDSANPLNAKQVTLTFSTGNVSRILPKAATYLSDGTNGIDRGVNLDLVTTDQFGNRTDDDTDLSDDSASASFTGNDNGQFTGEGPHVNAQSNPTTGDQKITSQWAGARKTTWHDTDPGAGVAWSPLGAANPLSGSATISWYVVDTAASTYTMSHTGGSGSQPVGATVTESYKAIDQNGQPMAWREVDFFRTGPDQQQDGNPQQTTHSTRTNADGVATYVFQGARPGNATIAGLLYDENDQPIEASKTNDTVTFANPVTPPSNQPATIKATLTLSNTKRGADVLLVRTSTAAVGAKVSFYKFVNDRKVLLGTGKVRANGYAKAVVADAAKKKNTYYSVSIGATAKTKAATSNTAKIK